MNFTFATARTIYSAGLIASGLNINVPCILNNGASVYDIPRGEYVRNAYIPTDTAEKILSAFESGGVPCFVFRFVNGVLTTCHGDVSEPAMRNYVEDRKRKCAQPFMECPDIRSANDGTAIYINSTGGYERLLPIRNAVMATEGADCAFYEDTYTKEWYLETFSAEASKANGIRFLREKYGFDEVVCFGDNLNDLSMFRESDMRIAVGNAHPEVKAAADYVIGSNDEDGVAEWLMSNF